MKTYLSKSHFKVARTCATKLYYKKLGYPSIRDDDQYLQFLADGGYMVEAIAKLCHPGGIEIGFDGGPELSFEGTMVAIKANEVATLFEATLIWENRIARVDILEKSGNSLRLIEVKAKSVDTSTGKNPFRGVKGNISSNWQPYLEDVVFQCSVLRNLFPEVKVTPYLCLVDKSKTTSIHSLFSKFQLSASNLDEARFRRPKVAYTGDADKLRRDHFLAELDVTEEVQELLPEVERSSAEFVASLKNGVSKIQVPINVGCRGCEYRLAARDISGGNRQNGFAECWGSLANEDP